MAHLLTYDRMTEYDPAQPGINISVRLSVADAEVTFDAKIDTGATHCIFARQWSEQLGLVLEAGIPKRIRTATGSFLTYEHDVNLTVLGYEFSVLACFAADEDFQTNVLGRYGFLMLVQLGLIDYEGKLFLSPFSGEASTHP